MGEAKQRHHAKRQQPCICGSRKLAADCCWIESGWFTAPSKIDLKATGYVGRHEKCYLKELNSCSTKISGEHLISKAVLEVLGKKMITVSGLPWLDGEARAVGIGGLTGNCLCTAHNSALSPLDDVAGRFYRSVGELAKGQVPLGHRMLFSGHDLERWLLKTLAGLAASKNLMQGDERLQGLFAGEVDLPTLLQDPSAWLSPVGLYATQQVGSKVRIGPEFELAPMVAPTTKEIGGLIASVCGFEFILIAVPSAIVDGTLLDGRYRTAAIHLNFPDGLRSITLSWTSRR